MKFTLIWLFSFLTAWMTFNYIQPITKTETGVTLNDFSYYCLVVKEYLNTGNSIYYESTLRNSLSDYLPSDSNLTLWPVAVFPTAIILFSPSALIFDFSPSIANAIWAGTLLSGLVFLAFRYKLTRNIPILIITLTSYSFTSNFLHSQTGALIFLLLLYFIKEPKLNSLTLVLLLFVSTIKIQYFVLCSLALWFWRGRSPTIQWTTACILTGVASVLLLGPSWFSDFFSMLELYAQSTKPEIYKDSFDLTTKMITLPQVLPPTWFYHALLLGFLCALITIFAFLKRYFTPAMAFSSSLAAFCLFSPHFTYYEEFLIIIPYAFIGLQRSSLTLLNLIFACLLLNYVPLKVVLSPEIAWIIKLIYFAILLKQTYQSHPATADNQP